ncbi:TetR/AcrR family transcriptional regulator [Curtobacterium sp. Csp1]|uniref:TetR/AcrR family transcriptional regulator n=1 Tax=Curtobacterium sp. Csp1 TaxID=2495429 RepID=UPI00159A0713|nr:TetR/AcrR family transcriptional regulator [Curtobacterium sp. Csp1]QKS21643.1 TetR/AcrR family transcriptional regulator [Curtobacterium sp. Csp1]
MTISTDRRAALKAKHRAAILQAARDLVDEQGGRGFSVDDLAARADIARRTVFNHFASLDEVLLAVCEQELSVIIDRFLADMARTPIGDGSRASMFDELESAARGADLAPAIAGMYNILGDPGKEDSKAAVLTQTAFGRVTERLRDEVARRHPGADVARPPRPRAHPGDPARLGRAAEPPRAQRPLRLHAGALTPPSPGVHRRTPNRNST